jgi:hypothetical protein
MLQVAGCDILVRAEPVRRKRLGEAVTVALGEKYNNEASRKWVDGFSEPARERTTLELEQRRSRGEGRKRVE